MEERSAAAGGRRFRYLERPGTGPALLFLHGLGDSADKFEPVAARLPGGWRLLALDQRGHGGSFRPDQGYLPFDFADDAAAFLDELGLPSAHLFGHSMGGRNALLLAVRHPERARSLILGVEEMEPVR
jgi:pimeloyl-ACP methyl ester carboxylesterase